MIHLQGIFIDNGTFFRPIKIIILDATNADKLLISAFIHFKDLEVRDTLCYLLAIEGTIYIASQLGIAVVAWLTDD